MRRPTLALVPFYLGTATISIETLARDLDRLLALDVRTLPPWFDPEAAYDPSRGQYLSTRLLALLDDGAGTAFHRVLGVTAADLFVPVLTYVFGEAQVDGRAAIVSIHRLQPEAYGLPRDDELLAARLRKEAAHELGHCDGLLHCREAECVMHPSTYAEEIDLKPDRRCPACDERSGSPGTPDTGRPWRA